MRFDANKISSAVRLALSLGVAGTAPYAVPLGNFSLGSHGIYAVATDSLGLSCTSSPVNFTIVAAPTNLTWAVSATNLTVSWPADHLGWSLMTQTNNRERGVSLNTNDWSRIPGSQTNTQVRISRDAISAPGFYRLVYP